MRKMRRRPLVAAAETRTARAAPTIEQVVGHKILLLANLMSRAATARYRKLVGLPQVEWRIIALLGNMPAMGLTELAHRAGLDKSQICRGVNNLVRRELLDRSSDLGDNRAIRLSLTERGGAMFERLLGAAQERNSFLLGDLHAKERAAFLALLDRITERARLLVDHERLETRARRRHKSARGSKRRRAPK
jgi:DNA-binding MarR family transcriptional regulator